MWLGRDALGQLWLYLCDEKPTSNFKNNRFHCHTCNGITIALDNGKTKTFRNLAVGELIEVDFTFRK